MDPTSITLPRRNLCRFAREIIFQEATREFSRLLLLQQRLSSPRSKLDDYSTLRCSDQEACLQRVEWKKKKHRTNAMDSFSLSLKYYKVSLRIRRARTITIGPPKIRCRENFSAETDPKKAKFLTIFLRTGRGPHPASVRSRAAALGGGVGLRSALFPVVPLLLLSGPVLVPIRAPGVGQKTGGGQKWPIFG